MLAKKITWFLLMLCGSLYSQCFDCNKNIGTWINDYAMDVEKVPDGIVNLVETYGGLGEFIQKYDFNCNLLWSKSFEEHDISVESVTSDPAGNIYVIIRNSRSFNAGPGPWNYSGFMMTQGLNVFKLNPQGDIIWYRHIRAGMSYKLVNIGFINNVLYVTGAFYGSLTFISSSVSFNHTDSNYARAFIAKYDADGNFMDAAEYGNGNEEFGISEFDPQGNTYLTYRSVNYYYSKLDKIDSNLDVVWSDTLTTAAPNDNTAGVYNPTGIRFNIENQKLYVWGGMNLNVNIMGHPFFMSTNNGNFQSALIEINTSTGALTNIKRFDNNTEYSVPNLSGLPVFKGAFMKEKSGELYVFTVFQGDMTFPNGTVSSTTYYNGQYDSNELLLFKVKLSDFTTEKIFQSHGVENLNYAVSNFPGDILFHGDDLYLTGTIESKPLSINGSLINNNSGNNNSDGMLYKFNINNVQNTGTIVAQHTCLNDQTQFSLPGSYDAIMWNFGDAASGNNASTAPSPQHQFTATGSYHVTATLTCGANTQTVEKDVTISQLPVLNSVPAFTSCEDSSGSGISSTFDITQLKSMLIGTQANVTLTYYTEAGESLLSPLPNPFTNTVPGNQNIVVRAYFGQNSSCYAEGHITFSTLAKPVAPIAVPEQNFCVQQNASLNNLVIEGQNIKWYDSISSGNLIEANTLLQDGATYYASQNVGFCESSRVPVLVHVFHTLPPTGSASQIFCAHQNPKLSDVVLSGNSIQWYTAASGGIALSTDILLTNGSTYYASQTLNNCESMDRIAVSVVLMTSLNANNYNNSICDYLNDGVELVDLSQYNQHLLTDVSNTTFDYYHSLAGAENLMLSDQINTISQFTLTLGANDVYARITSANGCSQVVILSLNVVQTPVINLPDIVPICTNTEITIDAGSGFDNYLWSGGETTRTIKVSQAGVYSVTVDKIYNDVTCSNTKNFNVVNSDTAVITDVVMTDWSDYANIITVQATGTGNYEYSLNGMDFQDSNVFTELPCGIYEVYVRDKNGCGVVTQEIVLLMYPRYFTPNGDGINDYWAVKFSVFEPGLEVSIFDRYGKFLYHMPYNGHWTGEYNGQRLPADDYWFVVTRSNGKVERGHFTLKR